MICPKFEFYPEESGREPEGGKKYNFIKNYKVYNEKNEKKTQKTQKSPIKPNKTQKNPLGWVLLKKPGFFPTLDTTYTI